MLLLDRLGGVSADMAVDLGTANTLVYVRGRGIVLAEPSVVAIDQRTNEVYAVGDQAKRMIGRTPAAIAAIRPLRDGVISDFAVTEEMLRYFIEKALPRRFARRRVVVCVPSGVTGVERRAVEEAARAAGAREVYLIEEPLAAAIGAGLPVAEPAGNLIVDIGGGTSEVAVISLGGVVVCQSLRVGGDEMDEVIAAHLKVTYRLAVGLQTPEEIKPARGSAAPLAQEEQVEIRGRDLISGLPKGVTLSSKEVREALAEPVGQIVAAVVATLERAPSDATLQIEVKAHADPALARRTARALCERLRHHPARERSEVISFWSGACELAAELGFRARLVAIADYRIHALSAWGRRVGLHGVCVEHFLLSRTLVATLRASGLSVTTGTVNHAPLLAPLLPLGLDAVTSDSPHELREALSQADVAPQLAA